MKYFLLLACFTLSVLVSKGQTQQDTIYTLFTKSPVVVDGSDSDECWSKTNWHTIDQVWIPYNGIMDEGDFEGRYKVAWDANYLYVLVEVVDDSLSDDYSNPLDNYWNDDCVEIFIDEDRSKGNHQTNNNAFAYHCSLFYDVIDAVNNGSTANCKNNLTMVMDTIGDHRYLWEFAVKMYNKNYSMSNPEASRVKLKPNKLMGFSIAYCDNDETKSRENFIGSMYMTQAHANDNYITADYFGSMLLIDPENNWVSSKDIPNAHENFWVYPTFIIDYLTINIASDTQESYLVEIISSKGLVLDKKNISGRQSSIDVSGMNKGIYFIKISSGLNSEIKKVVKL